MNTKEGVVIPGLPPSSVTSAPTVHPIICCLDFSCLLGGSFLTSFSLPIFCSHCPDSVHELRKWLSGQASVSTCPQVLTTYLTLGIVTGTWAVETGDSPGGHGLTSLGCHEHREILSQSGTHTCTHKQGTHKHTRRGGSFYPQITMQADFLIIRNIECWGNGSVDKALAAQI